jgi:hypothetical protein
VCECRCVECVYVSTYRVKGEKARGK